MKPWNESEEVLRRAAERRAAADEERLAAIGAQGINLHRGTWHGVLTPLHAPGLFAVVDRIGATPNLEEFRYAAPWVVSD